LSGINKNLISKSSILSYAIFAFLVSIILLCSVSVIFPALIQSTTSEFSEFPFYSPLVDPFELGGLAIPFVILNGVVLLIGIVYYKKHYSLNRLFDFDVSNKISIIVITIILSIYIAATVGEFAIEESWYDLRNVQETVDNWAIDDLQRFDVHVNNFLLSLSIYLFDNIRVIPFVASISLLIATFFITKEITKKRVPGIIAMVLVLQSNIFLSYDTSATYSNFWVLFYILSLYLILRKWQLSQVAFMLSIFSKLLSIVFLPMTIFFILNNTNGRKRIYIIILYGILTILGLFAASNLGILFVDEQYIPENFMKGIESFSYQLRFDPIILIFLLPLSIMLFLKSLKGFSQANSIQVLILGFLLIPPLLITFTQQTNEPYRLILLVVFFAIGVGTLLGKIKQDES
jgi:hypothetical protein